MDRTSRRLRVALATGLVMLSLTAFAGSASAAPGPTPNGQIGACNMMMSWFADDAPNGMAHAMTVNNPEHSWFAGNGNAGMTRAVTNTGGKC
jgi:hypothetical protein